MRNIYEFEVRAICPVHKELVDVYAVTIRSGETIKVETILAWFKQYESKQIFQEDMTRETAVGLGAHVETVGMHSGVKVTSIAP